MTSLHLHLLAPAGGVADPPDALFSWLSGVVDLKVETVYSCATRFTPAAFTHLGGLQALTLNMIAFSHDLLGDGLACLTSLRRLHLSRGRTVHFPARSFACMPLLQELSFVECGGVADDALAHLTGLTKLCIIGYDGRGITDAGCKHLGRLKILSISSPKKGITDAAFAHLSSLEELDMSYNDHITGAAFVHFTKLHRLTMFSCSQESICDASFSHLTRLTKLDIGRCYQRTVTDAAFAHLGRLVELTMRGADYAWLTAAGFKYLTSLRHLTCCDVEFSWGELAPLTALQSLTFHRPPSRTRWSVPPPSLDGLVKLSVSQLYSTLQLTDAMLQRLTCLTSLRLQGGGQLSDAAFTGCGKLLELDLGMTQQWGEECSISDSAFAHLTSLTRLALRLFSGPITEAAFRHLSALQALECDGNPAVTDAWICQLPCLRELRIPRCRQEAITDAAFRHLSLLEVLNVNGCTQPTITDAAFAHLPSLRKLLMAGCYQASITPAVAGHLSHVASVNCSECSPSVVKALQLEPPISPHSQR